MNQSEEPSFLGLANPQLSLAQASACLLLRSVEEEGWKRVKWDQTQPGRATIQRSIHSLELFALIPKARCPRSAAFGVSYNIVTFFFVAEVLCTRPVTIRLAAGCKQ